MAKNKDVPAKGKGYTNVADLMVDVLGDESIREDLAAIHEQSKTVYAMVEARIRARVSQEQIAKKMGCSQSTISRIECGTDADVSVAEMLKWFEACGLKVTIEIDPVSATGYSNAERMKMAVLSAKARVETLAALAEETGAGEQMLRDIEAFRSRVLLNLLAPTEPARALKTAAEPQAAYKAARKPRAKPPSKPKGNPQKKRKK